MPAPAPPRSRRGLSLLEVAVVLVIAIAACFLLLPALNRSRENARAGYCSGNLRRLYQAMQDHYDQQESAFDSLTAARNNTEGRWPLNLQDYLDDSSFDKAQSDRPVLDDSSLDKAQSDRPIPKRPTSLTCPSHPQSLDRENPSKCLYVLVLEEVQPRPPKRPYIRWAFRDCARDLEAAKPNDTWWSSGHVITRDEADAQLGNQLGPHADGIFQEWGLTSQRAWAADSQDAHAERLEPRF